MANDEGQMKCKTRLRQKHYGGAGKV